jgi:phosphopantothenoylcysteine decarboxylase / phosphopantothenate---cysteine ligase
VGRARIGEEAAVDAKRILLIVGGGVAAFKALEVARLLRRRGVAVRPLLTDAGARFVTPLSLSALCEDKVYQDLWSLTDEAEMGHIELSRSADLLVVCPATADLMARAAAGICDDLATTTLLATDKPVLMAPAMNVRMWGHPATRRNLARLQADGVRVVGPTEGAMACGEWGEGRLAEPEAIADAVLDYLAELDGLAARPLGRGPLAGRRVLVTAGPTREAIDPVRYLSNHSSGKQGYAVAAALQRLGAEVTLVSGPTALAAPAGVRRVEVESALEMQAACRAALPADVAVLVAAVADWRVEAATGSKLKKRADGAPPELRLVETPDILAELARPGLERPRLVVGFAAETDDLLANARAKLARKGCDWIVANDVSAGVFGADDNEVSLVTTAGAQAWGRASKAAIAERLATRIAEALA